jgi:type II secretory pathway pseudopilin PulG
MAYNQKSPNKRAKKQHICRQTAGFTLVEALITLMMGTLLAGIFLDVFGQLMRTSTATQNEMCANAIAQAMTETSLALGYDFLAANMNTYDLQVNNTLTASPPPIVKPNAVLLDLLNKSWKDKVVASQFRGLAKYRIENAVGLANAIKVSTIVSWTDSARIESSGRTVTTSLIISKSGLNKWAQ